MERPIIFSTPMVQAILEGRKTQTRRVIKPQPRYKLRPSLEFEDGRIVRWNEYSEYPVADKVTGSPWGYSYKVPFDKNEILWVRETWIKADDGYHYKADIEVPSESEDLRKAYGYKWKPSIHMPREAARIFLTVKNVRVERLQDISEVDANAEGVKDPYDYQSPEYYEQPHMRELEINKSAFAGLWDSINAKRGYGWEKNPWVFVIEFERQV